MAAEALYDTIGHGYGRWRREDPRIAAALIAALGDARSVVNVGAGAGSYEPKDRRVVAVEPSGVMIQQRRAGAGPVVRGVAESLPFRDDSVDAALAVLTVHHWMDLQAGLEELMRVARHRVVVFTHDPNAKAFWLNDYFPEIVEVDSGRLPELATIDRALGPTRVVEVPVPHDCLDGFLCAFWRRPHAYLDPEVRAGISCFPEITHEEQGVAELSRDLESGEWTRRYGEVMELDSLDLGYRILVAETTSR